MTDPDAFLRAYHAAHPGATAVAFARGRTGDGRSSYQLLADLPGAAARVLDLGCGDGYLLELLRERGFGSDQLVGVDMSEHELAAARRRPLLADVALHHERAQALSAPDRSIDWVLSHLAVMLMTEPAAVLAQIARALRPGGQFATIVGGGPGEGDAFALVLDVFREAYAATDVKAPRIGDKRTRHGEGLTQLCAGLGFGAFVDDGHVIHLDGTAAEVWDSVGSMYQAFALSESARSELRDRFVAAASQRWGERVPCTMRVRLVRARYHGP